LISVFSSSFDITVLPYLSFLYSLVFSSYIKSPSGVPIPTVIIFTLFSFASFIASSTFLEWSSPSVSSIMYFSPLYEIRYCVAVIIASAIFVPGREAYPGRECP
jgi:hypothetical protein